VLEHDVPIDRLDPGVHHPGECNIQPTLPRYPLAPVRDARARDERTHRGKLADAAHDAKISEADVQRAADRIGAARSALVTARTARDALLAAGVTPARLVVAEAYLTRRRRELDAATAEHLRAHAAHTGRLEAIDDARGALARARADKEVVERHFSAWREAQRKLAERRED